jgi:hypothetical protein
MGATLKPCDHYVTGVTRWDDGRVEHWDNFVDRFIACPQTERFSPEFEFDDPVARRRKLPPGSVGYTVTIQSCEKLSPDQEESEREIAEHQDVKVRTDANPAA